MSLQDIIKTNNIIRIALHDNLSSALSKLKSSHDSAFLFDDENKFLGLVNPYYSLIKSSFPGNAKVENCVYHPPKVYIDYSIQKTAELLIESKVHYLPILDRNENFIGIISARRLMQHFRSLPFFKIKIKDLFKHKSKPLSVIFEDDTVQRAVNLFKLTKHSKLIVVNKDEKLKGILSYYDLISYLVSPKTSEKRGEREGNKVNFYHHKVKNFAKSYVLTLSLEDTLDKAINLILDKRIGSVVIVDSKRYPVGIITTRDLLRFFIQSQNGKEAEMIRKNVSTKSRQIIGGFFSHVFQPVANTIRKFKKDD